MLVLTLPAFESKKYISYDRLYGNGVYGKIPTKEESIRTLEFTQRLPCHIMKVRIFHSVLVTALLVKTAGRRRDLAYKLQTQNLVTKIWKD